MHISATIRNSPLNHEVVVSTEGNSRSIAIPSKTQGHGSSVNGGELLFLALATCFCNDIYREAARRNMNIQSVDVTVNGKFGKEGEAGTDIVYETQVVAPEHSQKEIDELIHHVDRIAEIHNTLRNGASVTLKH
jgi:organic hydroperoxide reductase OsmC/OhrA